MTKINYHVDDELFDLDESPEAAIVTVKTHQGETLELQRLYPTGDLRSPAIKAQFRTKIERCLGSKINVDKFINAFDNMEKHSNMNALTDHYKG